MDQEPPIVERLLDRLGRAFRSCFPSPESADAGGLVAVGGDLSIPRLLDAYRQGIFPWYEAGGPILWWSPDPRLVLEPQAFRASRSLCAVIRRGTFEVRLDTAFADVIRACAETKRRHEEGTWITPEVQSAYTTLHEIGYAHSIESWSDGELVGGLYGLLIGRCFFGESMFSRRTDASKVALAALVEHLNKLDVPLIDCQVTSAHLLSLGAREIPRAEFLRRLKEALEYPTQREKWTRDHPTAGEPASS
jgi:leucyl/phenylalanyl-tRNA--protein transferase